MAREGGVFLKSTFIYTYYNLHKYTKIGIQKCLIKKEKSALLLPPYELHKLYILQKRKRRTHLRNLKFFYL